jgi:hypothetical protein
VSTRRDNTTILAADSAAAGGAGPAPVPGAAAAPEDEVGPTPLGALVPLGVQHVGQRVSASGQALTAAGNGGFWLRSDADAVIWVASRQAVKAGQPVQDLEGVLEPSRAGQAEQRLTENDVLRQAQHWSGSQLATEVYLDANSPDSSDALRARGKPPGRHAGGATRGRGLAKGGKGGGGEWRVGE